MARDDAPDNAGELRARLTSLPADGAVDPEDLWALGDELGYSVEIVWSGSGEEGCFDAVCRRRAVEDVPAEADATALAEAERVLPWSHYANNPLRKAIDRDLSPELRCFLKNRAVARLHDPVRVRGDGRAAA